MLKKVLTDGVCNRGWPGASHSCQWPRGRMWRFDAVAAIDVIVTAGWRSRAGTADATGSGDGFNESVQRKEAKELPEPEVAIKHK
jgi:hypothetical protein